MIIEFLVAFGVIGGGYYGVQAYNEFIRTKEMISNAKAQISTQIESRWDILKSMIQATEHYSIHEAKTLENIVVGRRRVNGFSSTEEIEQAEGIYQGSLMKLIALAENYPDLKASNLYKEMMENANKYENNVRLSRMTFNDTITRYNRMIKTIPSNIVAMMAGFKEEEYLKIPENKLELPNWTLEFE